jgi:hypothetical protein
VKIFIKIRFCCRAPKLLLYKKLSRCKLNLGGFAPIFYETFRNSRNFSCIFFENLLRLAHASRANNWKSAARDRHLNVAVSKLMSGIGRILADAKAKAPVPVIVFWRVNWLSQSRQVLTESHILSERRYSRKEFTKEYGRQDRRIRQPKALGRSERGVFFGK